MVKLKRNKNKATAKLHIHEIVCTSNAGVDNGMYMSSNTAQYQHKFRNSQLILFLHLTIHCTSIIELSEANPTQR